MNKYLGHTGGLIGPVTMEKPKPNQYNKGDDESKFYKNDLAEYEEHLSTLPVIPCEGWVPEVGREYTEVVDFRLFDSDKWYWCVCENCGWSDSSQYAAGGEPIADTGDYFDPCCPKCGSIELEGDVPKYIPEQYSGIVAVPIPQGEAIPKELVGEVAGGDEVQQFLQYVKQSRQDFCKVVRGLPEFNVRLRTAVDSLLICFDQMADRLQSPAYPAEFVEWMAQHALRVGVDKYKYYKSAAIFTKATLYQEYLKQKEG